ncbi:MAG: hypothetical protein KF821_01780 [Anaerolineales bacterium]|nr:hypothetical protein [Anaerolineales bacterium]
MNNPSPTTDTTWLEKATSEDNWREQLDLLVGQHKHPEDVGNLAACKRLAPKLRAVAGGRVSWTPNYILGVLHRNKGMSAPSPIFTNALAALLRRKRDRSKDKLRVCVPVATAAERDYINRTLNAEEKRNALLVAAYFEEEA